MPESSEVPPPDPASIARQIAQRLESLERSGLDRIPIRLADSTPKSSTPRKGTATTSEQTRPIQSSVPGPSSEPSPQPRAARPARSMPPPPPALAGSFFDEGAEALGPPTPAGERLAILEAEAAVVADCTRCPALVASRSRTVYGEGSPTARLMFLGEAPGSNEDRTGRPFVGKAGQLLDDMITKGMGLRREDVYIANTIKCHPLNNRDPEPEEAANCRGYLERQIAVVRPEFLAILGKIAAQSILDTALPLGRLRGRPHHYLGIPTFVTYHPAYLLRNPAAKREAWEDLKALMLAMGIAAPERRKRPDP